jgi:amidohydrolase
MQTARLISISFASLAGGLVLANAEESPLTSKIDNAYPQLEALYQHLHANPELSLQEEQTANRFGQDLAQIGFNVTYNVGGHGVVGVLENGPGPTVMIRTDLDALPITEETGLPYASTVRARTEELKMTGVMHACGHDVHMTVCVGTAQMLADMKDTWSGTVVIIGQPAEERGIGARAMLEDGLFEKYPTPDYALALHVASDLEAGKVAYIKEFAMANVDTAEIVIHGKGGHGAAPHKTIDPVVIAAQVVLALQTIVSRELDPLDPAVVTVGSIHGGSQANIIPDEVTLQLTVRSYSDETRTHLLEAIDRIATQIARAARVPEDRLPTVTVKEEYTPALFNDPGLTQTLVSVFKNEFGPENVIERQPEMIGEDFARYGRTKEDIPIFMFRLGTIEAGDPNQPTDFPSLHSAQFAPLPEPTIKTGVRAMTEAALNLLQNLPSP